MGKRARIRAGILATFLCIVAMSICSAAAQENKVFLIAGYDSSGNLITDIGAAVVVEDSGECHVIANDVVVGSDVSIYALVDIDENGDTVAYQIDYERAFTDHKLALFAFQDDMLPAPVIMNPSAGSVDQILEVAYFINTQSELERRSCKIRLTEAVAEEDVPSLTLLNGDIIEGDLLPEIIFPGALIDDDGNMVGLCAPDGKVVGFSTDVDAFYGRTGDGGGSETKRSEESQTQAEESSADEKKRGNSEPAEKGHVRGGGGSDEEDNEGSNLMTVLIAILVVIVIAIAAVVGVGKLKEKKKTPAQVPPAPNPVPPTPNPAPSPILSGTEPLPPRPVAPPSPAAPKPQPERAEIVGTAGIMQGRIYPVGSEGLSIGREMSSGVRFPADTKGVSRNHCRLFQDDQGRLMLVDCNSSYGTYLTGYGKLPGMHPIQVKNGDTFYLGTEKIAFRIQCRT